MKHSEPKELNTVRVVSVSSAATPDGRVAIVFQLQDQSIALEMNQQTVAALRAQIAAIETFLNQQGGRA
jgi:hypothetical protein